MQNDKHHNQITTIKLTQQIKYVNKTKKNNTVVMSSIIRYL